MFLQDAHLALSLVLGPDQFLVAELGPGDLLGPLLVFLDQVRAADQRSVHGVKGEHGEERLVLVLLDELAGLAGEAVRQVLAVGTIRHPGIAVRGEVLLAAVRSAFGEASLVDVVALLGGPEFLSRPEVPLACEQGGVAFFLECLGDSHFLQIHPVVKRGGVKKAASSTAEEIGGVLARWIASGLYAESGG